MPDTADQFDFTQYDYIIDAIDTVTGKLEIIKRADVAGVPVISSMGAGNKLDPTAFRRDIPGSTAFVPSVVGLIVAGKVIKDLAKK